MDNLYKKATAYDLAGPHHLWGKNKQAIKTELEGLGHWADKVIWVQKPSDVSESSLAFVSTKDWDGNGKPDNIYIITNKVQSKEDMTFVAEVADAIRHEVDHIEKGRRIEGVDGGLATYEFSPEYSAKSAEFGFEKQLEKQLEKKTNESMSASARLSIIESLIKASSSLDKKGFLKEADMIDGIITKVHGKGPEEPVELDLGDFSNLGATNISKDEAFSAGESVCEISHKERDSSYMAKSQLSNIEEKARSLSDMIHNGEGIHDWMESHIAQADKMLTDVEHRLSFDKKD